MSIEENKALVLDWMEALSTGNVVKAKSFYADDCRFLVAGDMPYCGWMDLDGFLSQTKILQLSGPMTLEIGDVTAEGDKVWFEAQSFGMLKTGVRYENAYVFFVRLRAGKIVEYKEFIDTLYVNRVIDAPQVRGTPIPRYRIFDKPTAVIVSSRGLGDTLRSAAAPQE